MEAQSIIHFDDSIFKKTGLDLSENLTYENWETLLKGLQGVDQCSKWWIGDCLVLGEAKYGEKYAQAVEETPFDENSLRDMKWVSSNVSRSLRNANLSWSHHRAVAGLESDFQKEYLDTAETERLTVKEFRALIKTDFSKEKTIDDPMVLHISVSLEDFKSIEGDYLILCPITPDGVDLDSGIKVKIVKEK